MGEYLEDSRMIKAVNSEIERRKSLVQEIEPENVFVSGGFKNPAENCDKK